ncbi:MAG: PilZ domain-containing protein [Planctomycetota bacterium]
MNEVMTPRGVEPEKILQTAIDQKVPAIMSYLSKNKWHVAKVMLTKLAGDSLSVESTAPKKKQRPINIQVNQPVGISFKHGYGKFVFDTTVQGLEPSTDAGADRQSGGTIVLAVPEKIEVVQRRSYFRVNVPQSLKVQVLLWHRSGKREQKSHMQDTANELQNSCHGRLIDISAGGAQVILPGQKEALQGEFKKGQFVGVRFTPMPYETPVVLSAQIRNALPTADGQNVSLGLQIVGLEASTEGRQVLTRLIAIVERYYQINQSGVKQQDMQPVLSGV